MSAGLFQGDLVRLTAFDFELDSETLAGWTRGGAYERLLNSDPAFPRAAQPLREQFEKAEPRNDSYHFAIRTLTGDQLIGEAELDGIQWAHGDAWLGIGIGEPDFWGKGYGSDAMRLLLRFAFEELHLYRVSLNVFGYNQRAIHVYEKLGFQVEGRTRGTLQRGGRRWDLIFMGLLREEWEKAGKAKSAN